MRRWAFGAIAVLAFTGCGGDTGEEPVVIDDTGTTADSSATDSTTTTDSGEGTDSSVDSTVADSAGDTAIADSSVDGATSDSADTGAADTGAADTGAGDTGADDTGSADTGLADTGPADTGPADTGPADTGSGDTGSDASDAGGPTLVPSPAPTVTFPGSDVTTSRGGTGGGSLLHACPAGQAMIGVEVQPTTVGSFYNGIIGRYATVCGTVNVVGGSSAGTWNVTVSSGSRIPSTGFVGSYGSIGSLQTATCPANQVAVGFEGRASSGTNAIALRCAPLTITGTAGSYAVAIGTVGTTSMVGGSTGTAFAATNCPAGEVANGASLHAGEVLDAFAMQCGKPTLAFAPPKSLFLTPTTATTMRGGAGGGAVLSDCPEGEAPIGVEVAATSGFYAGAIGRYATVCGKMTVAAGTTAGTYVVNTTAGTRMPTTGYYGSYSSVGSVSTATCPAGSVALGFDGRASTNYMFAIGLRCAPLLINGSTSSGFAFGLGTTGATSIVGSSSGTGFGATDCATGAIASGASLRAGEVLDGYGLRCSNVTLSY